MGDHPTLSIIQASSKLHGFLTAELASLQEATTEGTEDETVAVWGAITGLFTACPDAMDVERCGNMEMGGMPRPNGEIKSGWWLTYPCEK